MIILLRIIFFFSMGAVSLSLYQTTKSLRAVMTSTPIPIQNLTIHYVGFSQ